MNEIVKRELKDELRYKDTIVLKYRLEYPEIIESQFEVGMNIFNRFNREKAKFLQNYIVNTLYYEAVELFEYNAANGYPVMEYEVVLGYEITYNEENIISLYYDQYEFRGGAHGNTIRNAQTWNLQNGRKISLFHFYPNNPYFILDILKQINYQIKQQIEDGTNYYFDNYCELVLETFSPENYYLTDKGIAIFFQQYDIAPYSSGIPVFLI